MTHDQRVAALAQTFGADISPLTKRLIVPSSATAKAWVIRRFSAQATGALLDLQNELGDSLASFDKDGRLIFPVMVNGVPTDVPLYGVSSFNNEPGIAVPLLRLTNGRFDFVADGGNRAEMRVIGGGMNNIFAIFNVQGGFSFFSATKDSMTLPGTVTFGDATVQKSALQTAVLNADVSESAGGLIDSGLFFNVTAGKRYAFRFLFDFTTVATSTGIGLTLQGPANPTSLLFNVRRSTSISAATFSYGQTVYGNPTGSTAASVLAGNSAELWGHILPSVSGVIKVQFRTSASGSAATLKAGSHGELVQLT